MCVFLHFAVLVYFRPPHILSSDLMNVFSLCSHKPSVSHTKWLLLTDSSSWTDLPLEQLEPPQPGSHWQVLGAMQRPWTQRSAQKAEEQERAERISEATVFSRVLQKPLNFQRKSVCNQHFWCGYVYDLIYMKLYITVFLTTLYSLQCFLLFHI